MGSEPRPQQLARVLAAALCAAVALAPAARGADATQCTADNPLGGLIRFQSTYHFQPIGPIGGGVGCDIDTQQLLRFDMRQKGPKVTRSTIEAMLPPSLKGSARETLVQQMLNQAGKQALLGTYYVGQLHYQIRRGGCAPSGGSGTITGISAGGVSGTLVLGEDSPTGFREVLNPAVGYMEFNAMNPELYSLGSLVGLSDVKAALSSHYEATAGYAKVTCDRCLVGVPGLPEIQPTTKPHSPNRGDPYGVTFGCPGATCFHVEPTKCAQSYGSHPAECLANPGKYAAVPFEGKSGWRGETPPGEFYGGGWYVSSEISWKICCGCGQGQPPPDFPNKPCPDTSAEDAALNLNRTKDAALIANLATLWKSYEEEMSKAQSHLQQFQTTMRACNIQNKLTELLAGTLGLFSPAGEAEIAAEGVGEAEAIKKAAEMLGEQIGDPGSTLLTVISKLMNNEDPDGEYHPQ